MSANNVVIAEFSGDSKSIMTRPLWQYDYGITLNFSGLNLPTAYQVHFSNQPMTGETTTQIGDATGIISIPDIYLTTGLYVYAWVYLHTDEDDGETVYMVTIPVQKRAKPTDEVPTPVQQSEIDQAIAALNHAVEATGQDVADANAAKVAAENAQTAAERAQGLAESAQAAAEHAQESAETAQGKAEEAQGFAETAESNARGFASDAAGSAGDAAAAKTAAETAEAHASGYATDALNAKNAAVAAKEAAVIAQGKAEDAQGNAERYATTAGNKAGEAAQSAQDAQGYSNTASSKAGEAANSATAAGNSATAANTDALKSEGYAVGKQNGADVGSGSPYYHNNSKYNAEQAAASATLAAQYNMGVSDDGTTLIFSGNTPRLTADASVVAIFCTGNTAPQAITSGQYVIWRGALYTATTNIASGETLSTSTNIAAVQDGGLNDVVAKTPVRDVQVNGTSVVTSGVANVPVASDNVTGVVKVREFTDGLRVDNNILKIYRASASNIKLGNEQARPIVPINQHESAFYGLAKAAGDSTQSASSNAVGTYTDTAIDKILAMLGVLAMVAPHESTTTASQAYATGKAFVYAGKLYKATSDIAQGYTITPGTNCTQTTLADLIGA